MTPSGTVDALTVGFGAARIASHNAGAAAVIAAHNAGAAAVIAAHNAGAEVAIVERTGPDRTGPERERERGS